MSLITYERSCLSARSKSPIQCTTTSRMLPLPLKLSAVHYGRIKKETKKQQEITNAFRFSLLVRKEIGRSDPACTRLCNTFCPLMHLEVLRHGVSSACLELQFWNLAVSTGLETCKFFEPPGYPGKGFCS